MSWNQRVSDSPWRNVQQNIIEKKNSVGGEIKPWFRDPDPILNVRIPAFIMTTL